MNLSRVRFSKTKSLLKLLYRADLDRIQGTYID